MDKGFDFPDVREFVAQWGYTAHIPRKGIDQSKRQKIPGYRRGGGSWRGPILG
jgi:putative transposase